jgi:hypothetical protein
MFVNFKSIKFEINKTNTSYIHSDIFVAVKIFSYFRMNDKNHRIFQINKRL